MRKLLVAAVMLLGVATASFSKNNSIGVRFGGDNEISYQRNLGKATRLELGLGLSGFGTEYFGLSGVHQWTWDLSGLGKGFAWYAGAGVGLGVLSKDFAVSILGQVGIEYTFNFPLRLSLDYRPGVNNIPGENFMSSGIALGARFCF